MTFYFFRCSTNAGLYLVTDKPKLPATVDVELCKMGRWVADETFTVVGNVKVDVSKQLIEKEIAERGYSVIRWDLGPRKKHGEGRKTGRDSKV
jgi:hypothetical protein